LKGSPTLPRRTTGSDSVCLESSSLIRTVGYQAPQGRQGGQDQRPLWHRTLVAHRPPCSGGCLPSRRLRSGASWRRNTQSRVPCCAACGRWRRKEPPGRWAPSCASSRVTTVRGGADRAGADATWQHGNVLAHPYTAEVIDCYPKTSDWWTAVPAMAPSPTASDTDPAARAASPQAKTPGTLVAFRTSV